MSSIRESPPFIQPRTEYLNARREGCVNKKIFTSLFISSCHGRISKNDISRNHQRINFCQTQARFFLQVHRSSGTGSVMETKNFEPLDGCYSFTWQYPIGSSKLVPLLCWGSKRWHFPSLAIYLDVQYFSFECPSLIFNILFGILYSKWSVFKIWIKTCLSRFTDPEVFWCSKSKQNKLQG